MPKQPKLTDLQLILLSSASARTDGSIFPIPASLKADGPRLDKSLRGLLGKKLVAEMDAAKPAQKWREQDDRRIGLTITDAGREAIAVEPTGNAPGATEGSGAADPPAPEKATISVKAGTKQALLVEMLEREGGASLYEITAATSWLSGSRRRLVRGNIGRDPVPSRPAGAARGGNKLPSKSQRPRRHAGLSVRNFLGATKPWGLIDRTRTLGKCRQTRVLVLVTHDLATRARYDRAGDQCAGLRSVRRSDDTRARGIQGSGYSS